MSWAVWISGPPASGKTAVARATAELLQACGEPVRLLDLDTILPRLIPELRPNTHAPDLTISVEEVLRLARRLEQRATARGTDQERSIT